MELYPNLLFEKQLLYISSISKFSARNLKRTMVTVPMELVDKYLELSEEALTPDYTDIYRSFIKKPEEINFFEEKIKRILRTFSK